jgi:hypothetical protein
VDIFADLHQQTLKLSIIENFLLDDSLMLLLNIAIPPLVVEQKKLTSSNCTCNPTPPVSVYVE